MSVTIRPYVNGGWEVDIRVELPDGTVIRERKKAPSASKAAAQRWADARERVLLVHGKPKPVQKRGGARAARRLHRSLLQSSGFDLNCGGILEATGNGARHLRAGKVPPPPTDNSRLACALTASVNGPRFQDRV